MIYWGRSIFTYVIGSLYTICDCEEGYSFHRPKAHFKLFSLKSESVVFRDQLYVYTPVCLHLSLYGVTMTMCILEK